MSRPGLRKESGFFLGMEFIGRFRGWMSQLAGGFNLLEAQKRGPT